MTEAAMTDDHGSPYLRREPRSEAEAREDVLRRVVREVQAHPGRRNSAITTLVRYGWTPAEADDAINAALREGGEDE